MNRRHWSPVVLAVAAMLANFQLGTAQAQKKAAEESDVADVPSQLRKIGGDAKKRYFLIGEKTGAEAPAEGYSLLIVLPAGDGGADFNPFIRRLHKYTLNEQWLVAQAVAPKWSKQQAETIVWPTESNPFKGAKFSTEALIESIIADVQEKSKVDSSRIFLLGWSSGGPPCYAATLKKDSPIRGAFIAMSVFKPETLPPLQNGKSKAFYLLQSPDDRMTRISFAEKAEKDLSAAGARVQLERYSGGHGWRGPVWQMIGDGVAWLEKSEPDAN